MRDGTDMTLVWETEVNSMIAATLHPVRPFMQQEGKQKRAGLVGVAFNTASSKWIAPDLKSLRCVAGL